MIGNIYHGDRLLRHSCDRSFGLEISSSRPRNSVAQKNRQPSEENERSHEITPPHQPQRGRRGEVIVERIILTQPIASGERHKTFLPRLSAIPPVSAHQSNKKVWGCRLFSSAIALGCLNAIGRGGLFRMSLTLYYHTIRHNRYSAAGSVK